MVLFSSCAPETAVFLLSTPENGDVPVYMKESRQSDDSVFSSYFYFDKPAELAAGENLLALTYETGSFCADIKAPLYLELLTGKKEIGDHVVLHASPAAGLVSERTECIVTDIAEPVTGFRLRTAAGNPVPAVRGIEIVPAADAFRGVRFDGGKLETGIGWNVSVASQSDLQVEVVPAEPSAVYRLEYRFSPDDRSELDNPVFVHITGSEESETLNLYPKRGRHFVYLYPRIPQDSVSEVTLTIPNDRFDFLSLVPWGAAGSDESIDRGIPAPLPADPGTVLGYPREKWRGDEFEVFAWNLYPKMLIFDTRDYAVQADFLKRLAFYVEKEGYVGKLLTDEQLADKHGWNAHDYRAVDLAAFYQTAFDRRFELNEKEQLLLQILLDNGILEYDSGNSLYLPVSGGLISVSRESSDYLREKFMIHEGIHGVFFADPGYREQAFGMWETLTENEKRFWLSFFGWMHYDTDNLYLMVNELQAYLLQQPAEQAEYYFRNHRSVPGLRANPYSAEAVTSLVDGDGEPFLRLAVQAGDLFYDATGISIDRFFCLEETAAEQE